MLIQVLGSGAGGGLPQWNCGCRNCQAAREEQPWIKPRTQSSIAVSADGHRWALINTSPDVRLQLAHAPQLQPGAHRDNPIAGVVLTDAEIDHTAGMLILREGDRLPVHATASVHDRLGSDFPMFPLLERYCGIDRHEVPIDGREFRIAGLSGLGFTALSLGGKAPPYVAQGVRARDGDNIALLITEHPSGRTALFAPALNEVGRALEARMAEADCLLVDGTFWWDDEMEQTATGRKRAHEMGHLPLSGKDGMLAVLERLRRPEKYLVHINNTNPILDERSAERRQVEDAGVAVTHDGMRIDV